MSTPEPNRFRPVVGGLLAMLGVTLALGYAADSLVAADPKAATVRLVVDYGDGVEVHFKALKWREGMTVLDALTAAKMHPRGVSFSQRGSGRSAMITQIGDAKNQGGAADSRNWIYYVNDKQAESGAGVRTLEAGDTVLWKFQVYDYNS